MQAFHVFHTSCIIHWLLFCEYEIITKELVIPKSRKRRSKRNNAAKCEEIGKDGEVKATGTEIYSVFCPECQGTGKIIEGDELERPPISLSEVCSLWAHSFNFLVFYTLVCIFNIIYYRRS